MSNLRRMFTTIEVTDDAIALSTSYPNEYP